MELGCAGEEVPLGREGAALEKAAERGERCWEQAVAWLAACVLRALVEQLEMGLCDWFQP